MITSQIYRKIPFVSKNYEHHDESRLEKRLESCWWGTRSSALTGSVQSDWSEVFPEPGDHVLLTCGIANAKPELIYDKDDLK